MKQYTNVFLSLLSYLYIPIVYLCESQYFTAAKVGILTRSGYDSYLVSTGLPLIVLTLLGIFFALRGKRAKEPNWAIVSVMSAGIIFALIVLFAVAVGSSINGAEAA